MRKTQVSNVYTRKSIFMSYLIELGDMLNLDKMFLNRDIYFIVMRDENAGSRKQVASLSEKDIVMDDNRNWNQLQCSNYSCSDIYVLFFVFSLFNYTVYFNGLWPSKYYSMLTGYFRLCIRTIMNPYPESYNSFLFLFIFWSDTESLS